MLNEAQCRNERHEKNEGDQPDAQIAYLRRMINRHSLEMRLVGTQNQYRRGSNDLLEIEP
jgi:hypothetical protein